MTSPENINTPSSADEYKIEMLPEDYPKNDLSFKIILIGDSGVGKKCLTSKLLKINFDEHNQATVGFEFFIFNMKVNDKVIKFQIWDTCGQEIFKSLITNFYRNTSLAILIFAIDNKESFNHIEYYLNDLKSHANPDVRIILVGNKADLEEDRKVSKEEGEKYKESNHLDLFMETSVKTGHNFRDVLIEAAKILYKNYLKFDENNDNSENKFKENRKGQRLIKKDKREKKGCY